MLRNTYNYLSSGLKRFNYSPYATSSNRVTTVVHRKFSTDSSASASTSSTSNSNSTSNLNHLLNNNGNSSATPASVDLVGLKNIKNAGEKDRLKSLRENRDNRVRQPKYISTTTAIMNEKKNELIRSLVAKKPLDQVRAKHRFLIVGLGNPGKEYHFTRHNIGFLAVDKLAQLLGTDISSDLKHSVITTTWLKLDERQKTFNSKKIKQKKVGATNSIQDVDNKQEDADADVDVDVVLEVKKPNQVVCEVILAKPMKYMNLSGGSVRSLHNHYNVPVENILVLVDDMAIDLGKIRLRGKGGSGGQNGLEDIINRLGTEKVSRLRLGIGAPHPAQDRADYVLKKFPMESVQQIASVTEHAARVALMWIECGTALTMNKVNK